MWKLLIAQTLPAAALDLRLEHLEPRDVEVILSLSPEVEASFSGGALSLQGPGGAMASAADRVLALDRPGELALFHPAADAEEVAGAIAEIFGVPVVTDERENALLLVGTPLQVDTITDFMPAACTLRDEYAPAIAVFYLEHLDHRPAASAARAVADREGLDVEVIRDAPTNALILVGTQRDTDALAEHLEGLDRAFGQ